VGPSYPHFYQYLNGTKVQAINGNFTEPATPQMEKSTGSLLPVDE
jgi:hypothetical protein